MEATQSIKTSESKELELLYTGFVLIKKAHVMIAFVAILIVTAAQIGGMVYNVDKLNDGMALLDKRITVVELTQKESKIDADEQKAYNNIFLAELQFNLQVLMEKQGLNYKRFQTPDRTKK